VYKTAVTNPVADLYGLDTVSTDILDNICNIYMLIAHGAIGTIPALSEILLSLWTADRNINEVLCADIDFTNTLIKSRFLTILFSSTLTYGYRVLGADGNLRWTLTGKGLSEQDCIAFFNSYVPNATRPYDILKKAIHRNRSGLTDDKEYVWSPVGTITVDDCIPSINPNQTTTATVPMVGVSPNLIPLKEPRLSIASASRAISPFNMPVMEYINIAISNESVANPVNNDLIMTLKKRYVSAIFETYDFKYYTGVLNLCPNNQNYANMPGLRQFTPPATQTSLHTNAAKFELFWDGLLEQIPTMRQALNKYIGFNFY
jgi:hypothetical protein